MFGPVFVVLLGFAHIVSIGRCGSVPRAENEILRRGSGVTGSPGDQLFTVSGGAIYIRWGRTTCNGTGTSLVYSGSAGGSFFDVDGGAANYLCLPHDPQYGEHNAATNGLGEVWGAEYETSAFPFSLRPDGPQTLQNQNVPCAVCYSSLRTTALMIPARVDCYQGWDKEYSGYLMSGHKGHKGRTEYVCMDGQPEGLEGGYVDQNGALFYSVDGVCGSLPCPPYKNGWEITCVVCTK